MNNPFKHPDICIHGSIQIFEKIIFSMSSKNKYTNNRSFKNERKHNLPIKHECFLQCFQKLYFYRLRNLE